MPSTDPVEPTSRRKTFTVDEANNSLPLVRAIVADIVHQIETVQTLQLRLKSVQRGRTREEGDVYHDELAQSQSELDAEETRLLSLREELHRLGIELKGPDGLCDFPSLRDGRLVYLCWRLGEPRVAHWHEIEAGFSGRQPLERSATAHPAP